MFQSAFLICYKSILNDGKGKLGTVPHFIRIDAIEDLHYSREFAGVIGVIGGKHYLLKYKTCNFLDAWDALIPINKLD